MYSLVKTGVGLGVAWAIIGFIPVTTRLAFHRASKLPVRLKLSNKPTKTAILRLLCSPRREALRCGFRVLFDINSSFLQADLCGHQAQAAPARHEDLLDRLIERRRAYVPPAP
jgi:hypothetical protein